MQMKNKGSLQGFSKPEDEFDIQKDEEQQKYLQITYPGVCDAYCTQQPSKCLAGLYDQHNLQKNVRVLDQYYQKQMAFDSDFDERYFVNLNGIMNTPIKLISPLQYPGY